MYFYRVQDIKTRLDIERLISHFYKQLLSREEMKPVFEGIDLESHLPKIIHFWSFVLLDEEGYTTNVFDKHLHLPIKAYLFDVWVNDFCKAVDELFVGEKADLAKQRATVLGFTFKSKWQKLKPE